MDNTQDYYNTPELSEAQNASNAASETASNYSSAASLLPQKLRQAVMEKVNYNKDIIEARNTAQSEYFNAPSAARAKYVDPTSENYIFNPFQAENLVTEERTQAYQPYATLTDILGQRTGSLSDIIDSGVGAFNSSVTAQQGAADLARQKYSDLFNMAGVRQDQANLISGREQDQSNWERTFNKTSGSGGSGSGTTQATTDATVEGYAQAFASGAIDEADLISKAPELYAEIMKRVDVIISPGGDETETSSVNWGNLYNNMGYTESQKAGHQKTTDFIKEIFRQPSNEEKEDWWDRVFKKDRENNPSSY